VLPAGYQPAIPVGAGQEGSESVRIGAALLVVWLLIGGLAAGQRGYFGSDNDNCAEAGTTVVTVIAGPLNYVGANPKVKCDLPEPSA
jgi:hypothetical protein